MLLTESWYTADGQPVTLAYLVEDDSTVVALRGDPGVPGWQVIGHFAHEHEAGKTLPAPVPPGVLRSDISRFNRPAPASELSLQDLIRDVVEGHSASDASNALLGAVQRGYAAGPMVRLQELLETNDKFASTLETAQGRQIAARLSRGAGRSSSSPAKSKRQPRTSGRPSPSSPRTAPLRCAPARARPWTPHRPRHRPAPA